MKDEELKWRQRANEKDLKEGDGNTKYFHLKASGRKKKSKIVSLKYNGHDVLGEDNLIRHATDYYKSLFGPSVISNFRLEDMGGPTLNDDDRASLTKEFDLEEIKEVVFDLKHNKAAGPDGFPAEFYQKFWDIIKHDLKELFDAFHKGVLDIDKTSWDYYPDPKGA